MEDSCIKKIFHDSNIYISYKDRFKKVWGNVVLGAFFVHVFFLIFFFFTESTFMFYFNFISVSLFLLLVYLNDKGFLRTVIFFTATEVIVHQALCSVFFGMETMFWIYLLELFLGAFFLPRGNLLLKVIIPVLTFVTTIILYVYLVYHSPLTPFNREFTMIIGVGNLIAGFTFFLTFGYYYRRTSDEIEDALFKEQDKALSLLYNILPVSIAHKLIDSPTIIANHFKDCSILFADIVNFTDYTKSITPEELVTLLNIVFCKFDSIIEKYSIEKIKTIGDAYMAVSGAPVFAKNHLYNIVDAGLEMLECIGELSEKLDYPELSIRIGLDSGPSVGGVIGNKKFIYDIWGNSVNTAARLEATGTPNKIHVSENVYELLKNRYTFEKRGTVLLKGIGHTETYYLTGKI